MYLGWTCYLLISKLENKPDLQLQNFLEFDFLRKCEKSIANLWECETGETQNKEVRLGKSSCFKLVFVIYQTYLCGSNKYLYHVVRMDT